MVHWDESIIIAFATGIIAAGIALYFILRALFLTRKGLSVKDMTKDPPLKKERVEFVIDTFSNLINKLKEKEDAIERLRRHAETRASVAESYNEDILRSVGSGVVTFNMERVITTFNQAAERIMKRKREDVIGLSCADAFGPDNILCSLLSDALLTGNPLSRQEVDLKREGMSNIWVGLSISPLKDKDGKQIGIIMVFTDLTEIKMLREQGELKKRLAMLGEMSGGIAHEMRNSMGTIMGYMKLLSKSLNDDESSREIISTIVAEINSMDLIIKELLNYGKPVTPSLAPVDINSIIRKALDTTLERFSDIEVKVDLTVPNLSQMYADEVLMRQALQNIIQNGIEAMPTGGNLRIEVRSQRPAFRRLSEGRRQKAALRGESPPRPDTTHCIGLRPQWVPGNYTSGERVGEGDESEHRGRHGKDRPSVLSTDGIEILISDTGVGMPEDVIEKIFLPFYTTKPRGTGMGLALVHKIIIAHGGSINVESIEGKGTTFRIYLPWPQSL